jgi:periplasmic protein TonB
LPPGDSLDDYHHLPGDRIISLPQNLFRLYPDRAARIHLEGHAELHCVLEPDTYLHDCQVVAETPPGYGFGAATVKAATMIRARPLKLNGEILQRELIDFPFDWKLAG